MKFYSRSHKKTRNIHLCPVPLFGRAVQQLKRFVPRANDKTLFCTFNLTAKKTTFIIHAYIQNLLGKTYKQYDGTNRFRFVPQNISTKSLRSGAEMALFINNQSSDKIITLGRWKTKFFLKYIRTYVVEWTELFSGDMITFNNFFKLCARKSHLKSEPGTPAKSRENHYEILELCTELWWRNGGY